MLTDLQLASEKRSEELLMEEIDQRIDLLLAGTRYAAVTSNPRSMGYLRFLLRHYAKEIHPWRKCYVDNVHRFGPERTKGLCMSFDTPVNTSKGLYHISELKAGDEVWSYDGNDFILKEVLWSGVTGRNLDVMKIGIEGEREIFMTSDHKLLKYNEDWLEGRELSVGDYLLSPIAPSVVSSSYTGAFSTESMTFSNSCFSDSSIPLPQMSMRTSDISFSLFSLNNLMVDNDFFDFFSSSSGHQRIDNTGYCNSHIAVNSPVKSCLSSQIERVDFSDSEDSFNFFNRLDGILAGSYQSGGLSIGLGIPAKTSLALQESGSPSNVCGRQVTDVALSKESMDVWDIVVADTHNFVVHDFTIAHNCGVLKDVIRQNTYWRGKKGHSKVPDAGAPGVAIAYADKEAANPPWHGGGSKLSESKIDMGEMAMPEDIALALEDLGSSCDVYRVLVGLDSPPGKEIAI